MEEQEIRSFFTNILKKEQNVSAGMAAIRTLLRVLEKDSSETVRELDLNFQNAITIIKNSDVPITAIDSGCQLFMRFITFAKIDTKEFKECKNIMIERGKTFLSNLEKSRTKVAKLSSTFIIDGCKILTHSKSRVVLEAMIEAARANKRFEVFVTTSSLDKTGEQMCKSLKENNITCTLILDAAVGYIMEQVDMVMVGAEGVVESGGIINKIGSLSIALCAREMNKPFYVLTESFKFVRLYPLNQQDLPDAFKFTAKCKDTSKEHPSVDYTPPAYITLLFTDLGILTPSAVSDELIKLYL